MCKNRLRPEGYPAVEHLRCRLCGYDTPFRVETAARAIKRSGMYMVKCIVCDEYIFLMMLNAIDEEYSKEYEIRMVR